MVASWTATPSLNAEGQRDPTVNLWFFGVIRPVRGDVSRGG
jgi:hypothetical protein